MIERDVTNTTQNTIKAIKEYMNIKKIDKVVVSSTTGFTAKIFDDMNVINNDKCYICKQDLNENFCMKEEIKLEFEKDGYHVVDIPQKYLTNLLGIKAVNILRSFSQGIKVCIELLEFLINENEMRSGEVIVLVAGTVKGADTAICATLNNSGYAIEIIALPSE